MRGCQELESHASRITHYVIMKQSSKAILLVFAFFLVLVALNFIFFVDNEATEESEMSANRSSLRSTPYGTLAFYTLLEESGYPVTRLRNPYTILAERNDIGTVVVISPPAIYSPTPEEFGKMNAWVEKGGLLVIIDREIQIAFGETKVSTSWGGPKSDVRPLQPTPYTRGVSKLDLTEFTTRLNIEGSSFTNHIGDDDSSVLADIRVGEGRVVLLTEPHVVANNGISKADNVIAALNLFSGRPSGLIAFDEYHQGYGRSEQGSMLAYFSGTPIPWMLAQAALIAVLVIYTYGRRFARPLPLKRERRTTNLEFVSSMANITRLARASDLAMQSIYSEFRKRLCRYSGLPAKVDTPRLATVVAARAKIDERSLKSLLARCEAVERGKQISDAELLNLVGRIREIETQLKL